MSAGQQIGDESAVGMGDHDSGIGRWAAAISSRCRRRPAGSSAAAGQGWTGLCRPSGCWAGRKCTRGSSSRRSLRSDRTCPKLGMPDEVVGRRLDRIVDGHDDVPRRGVTAFTGNDEHGGQPVPWQSKYSARPSPMSSRPAKSGSCGFDAQPATTATATISRNRALTLSDDRAEPRQR